MSNQIASICVRMIVSIGGAFLVWPRYVRGKTVLELTAHRHNRAYKGNAVSQVHTATADRTAWQRKSEIRVSRRHELRIKTHLPAEKKRLNYYYLSLLRRTP
jgi:hypothetical protein